MPILRSALLLAVLLPLTGVPVVKAQGPRLGTISFPTSGAPAAQEAFLLGVRYLHSFQYESAEQAFGKAQTLEPGFAMAYWGQAMTHNHAVWNEQDAEAARAILARLGPTPESRRAKAPTTRERRYLEAVEILFGPGGKARRDTLYAAAMERLVREEPADLEAKAFYALALLGLNQGIRDTTTYLRAARFADTVFRSNPTHPGAAHYLIHSFDDPVHAPLGLESARAYSKIAPDAAHAQHMTTHIFLAMGLWDDVVSQNRIAVGLTSLLPGHYSSWLVYGLIQQGQLDTVRALMHAMRRNLVSGGTRPQQTALAGMRAHLSLHSNDRPDEGPDGVSPDGMTLWGRITEVFTDGAIAFRRRDHGTLAAAAIEVARLVESLRVDLGRSDPTSMAGDVMARQLAAMRLFLGGSRTQAVEALRETAAIEDAMPMEFGPPAIVEPSHELLGAMLMELDPRAARVEFEHALRLAPGRSRALAGLALGAIATGDKEAARTAVAALARNWRGADPLLRTELAALTEAARGMP